MSFIWYTILLYKLLHQFENKYINFRMEVVSHVAYELEYIGDIVVYHIPAERGNFFLCPCFVHLYCDHVFWVFEKLFFYINRDIFI